MRNDAEIRKAATAGFPSNLNDLEQERWLEIATPDELDASKKSAYHMGHPNSTILAISAEQRRRVERERHDKIMERLERLEQPHWTTTPVFWVTLVGTIAAGLAAYFGWLAIN